VARVEHRFIPGPTADLPVRIYYPEGAAADGRFGALVLFHGSGWVICNLDVNDVPARALANRSGCVVVAVNYQKAPEHKFPIPLDDCYATTCWVADHAAELGVDPARIGVGGDSSGGNLAAAVCLRARDEGGPALAFQLLIYPPTCSDLATATYESCAEGYGLQRESMRWFWDMYLTAPEDGRNPLASPLLADDLSGLPPAFVATAEFDPLRDDGERYAERLRDAGVPVKLRRYDGMIHAFYLMDGVIGQASQLFDEAGREAALALGNLGDAARGRAS
jgi:acetyl esterase